jgi:hypothetical protein
MKTIHWENERIFIINRDIDNMIKDKEIKTIVSLSLVSTPTDYSAILIYK